MTERSETAMAREIAEITHCGESEAARHLEQADGDLKTAILLGLGATRAAAGELLQRHGGNLRAAIDEHSRGHA